jgi:DTW domain-containing protein
MQILETPASAASDRRPHRCLGCFRPQLDCYCAAIPAIDNRTEIVILQHRRERRHPFNTARMVHRALRNSSLLVDHTAELAARLRLRPRAALLYPGPQAELLTDVPAEQRPRQLIVIDGTWHHAKTLVRDIPALHGLPRYRLAPHQPSTYRIRREPSAMFLSTVEATVAALRLLEPETGGLDELLGAFATMVDRQLAHPKSQQGWRRNATRIRGGRNIPSALLGNLDQVVVAYAECVVDDSDRRVPVYWTALRLGTGEAFACTIQPPRPLASSILRHLELTEEHFAAALPLDKARAAWQAFQRPDDVLAVYNAGTARLLPQLTSRPTACLMLKSIDFNPERRYGTLDDIVAAECLTVAPSQCPGRAGRRLASIVALIKHLRRLKCVTANGSSLP